MNSIVVIDDSGSPGSGIESLYLKDDRKTHVALILNEEERTVVEHEMKKCIEILKRRTGLTEFHFAEIYSGNGKFKNIHPNLRINIFKAFCEIFKSTRYPIIVQTCDSNFLNNNGIHIDGKVIFDGFKSDNNTHLSLFFLLLKCKDYLKCNKTKYGDMIDFIIDEGIHKDGYKKKTELLSGIASNNELLFKNSSDNCLLQLADFAAFSLNRMQILQIKEKRTEFDDDMLISICDANFNCINLPKVTAILGEPKNAVKSAFHTSDIFFTS